VAVSCFNNNAEWSYLIAITMQRGPDESTNVSVSNTVGLRVGKGLIRVHQCFKHN